MSLETSVPSGSTSKQQVTGSRAGLRRIRASAIASHLGEQVVLEGWLASVRTLGNITFLIVRDGSGTAQVVAGKAELAPLTSTGAGCESVVRITGEVVEQPRAPRGAELVSPIIEVLTPVREPPPVGLSKARLSARLPALLNHGPLTLRHPRRRSLFAASAAAVAGFRRYLAEQGYVEIHTPKIVASATESGANVFALDYFGQPAYLAQSPQFYKQTMVGVFERVFEVGPVFRAEPHATVRHLAEYTSLDVELGFIESHETVMAVVRDVLAAMVAAVASVAPTLEGLRLELPVVPEVIPAIDFRQAQELLERTTGEPVVGEPDLAPAHERELGQWARQEHGSPFLFVTGYPMAKRPFYTHPCPGNPAISNSFDLLYEGQELITGGQRLHRYEDYVQALSAMGEPLDAYGSYLEVFRYGMPRHGGFAIGLERFVMQLAGLDNIRQASLFPRDKNRLTP